jgi:hypothetical protein
MFSVQSGHVSAHHMFPLSKRELWAIDSALAIEHVTSFSFLLNPLAIHGLHISSQYCFEHSFWTDTRMSILLNALLMSADEDLIRSALQWLGNTMIFQREVNN